LNKTNPYLALKCAATSALSTVTKTTSSYDLANDSKTYDYSVPYYPKKTANNLLF
jgi:hypothetical protein